MLNLLGDLNNALLLKGFVESMHRSGSTIRHIDPMQLQRKPYEGLSS